MTRPFRVRDVARVLSPVVVAALLAGTAQTASAQTSPKPPPKAQPGAKGNGKTQPAAEEPKPAEDAAATPPPAAEPEPAKAEEEHKDDEEAKRAVYISADIGFTRMDLGGFSNSLAFDKTAANGITGSIGLGLRLRDIKVGARWRVFDTTEFNMWSFMVEAGYSLPLRPVSPGFVAHLGYVWDQSLERSLYPSALPANQRTVVLDPNVDVRGALVGAEVQAMYWIGKVARAGGYLGFDLLFLSRPQAGLPGSTFPLSDELRANALYTDSGSGVGYVFTVGLRGAADIGF